VPKLVEVSSFKWEDVWKSDVVVNMADPEEILYFVNDYSQKQENHFFPFKYCKNFSSNGSTCFG